MIVLFVFSFKPLLLLLCTLFTFFLFGLHIPTLEWWQYLPLCKIFDMHLAKKKNDKTKSTDFF